MSRLLRATLAILATVAICSMSTPSIASASALRCGPRLTVSGISCGHAHTVMAALMGSYAVGDPARFRYGTRHWVCRYNGPNRGLLLWKCVSNNIWFHIYWRSNWNQGNHTCPPPYLEDDFDGNTSTQLSIVDFEHTPGISCAYGTALYTAMYRGNKMRASGGFQTYAWHFERWHCQTIGAAGVAETRWWSDISIDCTSLPTAVTNLRQWLTIDLGMVPIIACTGNTTWGPQVSCDNELTVGNALDDSELPEPEGAAAAGLHWVNYSGYGSGGTMLVPTPDAVNHYALCVWRDVGPQDEDGVAEEGYVCTYGGK